MLTLAEVAAELRVSESWVRKEVARGRVTPLRVGDSPRAPMRFTPAHVAQFVASLQPAQPVEQLRTRRRRRA